METFNIVPSTGGSETGNPQEAARMSESRTATHNNKTYEEKSRRVFRSTPRGTSRDAKCNCGPGVACGHGERVVDPRRETGTLDIDMSTFGTDDVPIPGGEGFVTVGQGGRPVKNDAANKQVRSAKTKKGKNDAASEQVRSTQKKTVFRPSTKKGVAAASGNNGDDPLKKKGCTKCKPGLTCAACVAKKKSSAKTRKDRQKANRTKGTVTNASVDATPVATAAPVMAAAQDGKDTAAAVFTFAAKAAAKAATGVEVGAVAKAIAKKKERVTIEEEKVTIEEACGQTFACKVVKKLGNDNLGFVVSSAFNDQLFCMNMEDVAKGDVVQVKVQKNKPVEVAKGKNAFIGKVVPKPHPFGMGFMGTVVKSTHNGGLAGQNFYQVGGVPQRMMWFHGNEFWLFNVGDRVRFDVVEKNGDAAVVPVDGSAYKPHRMIGPCTGTIISMVDGSWWVETAEGRIVAPGDDKSNSGVVLTDGSLTKPTVGMRVKFDVMKTRYESHEMKARYGSHEINVARNLNEVDAAPFKNFKCVYSNLKNGHKCTTVGPSCEVNTEGDHHGRIMCTKCTKLFGVKSCESCKAHQLGGDLVSVNKMEFTKRRFVTKDKGKKSWTSMSVCTKCFEDFQRDTYVPCSSARCKAKWAENPNDLGNLYRPDKMKTQFQTGNLYCTYCATRSIECGLVGCTNVVSAVTGGYEHNGVFHCKSCLDKDTSTSDEVDVVNDCWQFVEKKGQKDRKAARKAAQADMIAEAVEDDVPKIDVLQWTPPSQEDIDAQNAIVAGLQSQLTKPVKQKSAKEKAAAKTRRLAVKKLNNQATKAGLTMFAEMIGDRTVGGELANIADNINFNEEKKKADKKMLSGGPKRGKGANRFQLHSHTRVARQMKISWLSPRAITDSLDYYKVKYSNWFVRFLHLLFAFYDTSRFTALTRKMKGLKGDHADKLAEINELIAVAEEADIITDEDMDEMLYLEEKLLKLDDEIWKTQTKLDTTVSEKQTDTGEIQRFVEDYLVGKFNDDEKTIAAAHEAQLQAYKDTAIENQFTLAIGKCNSYDVLVWIMKEMDLTTDINGLMSEFTALINSGNIEQAYADAMKLDEEWVTQCEELQLRHEEEQQRYHEEEQRRHKEESEAEKVTKQIAMKRRNVLDRSLMPKFVVPTANTTVPITVEVVVVREPTPSKVVVGFTFPKLDQTMISLGKRTTARVC